jgi:hypothetical protein
MFFAGSLSAASNAQERRTTEPLFLHRFAETSSDRPGFRKYVGYTKRVVVTGTLLGVYHDGDAPPGAVGGVAIGHTIFFRARDFAITNLTAGTSTLYVPDSIKLPAELISR